MINNRYKIIKKIGQGRSVVYLCNDVLFEDLIVAVKVLPKNSDMVEKENFWQEYFTLQKLEHANIIKAFELGTAMDIENFSEVEKGSSFMTLEFFNSEELMNSAFISNEADLRKIIKQLCSVLYYLHQSDYIYYDLKPENILVSKETEEPAIKVIDLGLAEKRKAGNESGIKGTSMYIAPELLKNEEHNNRVDLYSLGIILYKIVFGDFPFETKDDLKIYKAHVEQDFNFDKSTNFSNGLISVIKKLLNKNPEERYSNALQVLVDLQLEIDESVTRDFLPVKKFSSRTDVINILSAYINDISSSEVFSLKGYEGAGKTTVINYLYEHYPNSVRISNLKEKRGIDLIKFLLKRIFYSERVYNSLSDVDINNLKEMFGSLDSEFFSNLPAITNLLAEKKDLILLIDDYNLIEELALEFLEKIIPIFQVNNVKIILTESTDFPYSSEKINNVRDVIIGSFTDDELKKFIESSYSSHFEKEKLYGLISRYADLLPGSVTGFIKDLIILNIIQYDKEGEKFNDDESKLEQLLNTQEIIYNLRLQKISSAELELIKILSSLEVTIDVQTISKITSISKKQLHQLFKNLQINNLIHEINRGTSISLTSDGLKKYLYNLIEDKPGHHLGIASKTNNVDGFNRIELARHYELANEYDKSYNILIREVNEIEIHSAYSLMKKILSHIIEMPLEAKKLIEARIKLCEVFYKMSDYKSCLNLVKEIEINDLSQEKITKLLMLEASSYVGISEFNKGRDIFNSLVQSVNDKKIKQEILTETAYADFELKNYDDAEAKCNQILVEPGVENEINGRCYNLLAMIRIYRDNELEQALDQFKNATSHFENAGLPRRVAGVALNIGNVYNILGRFEQAEAHWLKAFDINKAVGNLNQEGIILLNFGIYYFDHHQYEKAIGNYKEASKIFLSVGNEINRGYVLYNLSETYLAICEYQNVLNSLQLAIKIFETAKNYEEIADVLFLFCKLYAKLHSKEKFKNCFDYLSKIVHENNLPEKYRAYLRYADILFQLLSGMPVKNIEEIFKLKKLFKDLEERSKLTDIVLIEIELLILTGEYKLAIAQLKGEEFVELIAQNSILEAQRDFLLGLISERYGSETLSAPLVYFERAYEQLKTESISELTWRTLLKIADIYTSRGNTNKAKEYYLYARELINFISENIQSPQLRNSFLNQNEIKNTLERIDSYYLA